MFQIKWPPLVTLFYAIEKKKRLKAEIQMVLFNHCLLDYWLFCQFQLRAQAQLHLRSVQCAKASSACAVYIAQKQTALAPWIQNSLKKKAMNSVHLIHNIIVLSISVIITYRMLYLYCSTEPKEHLLFQWFIKLDFTL